MSILPVSVGITPASEALTQTATPAAPGGVFSQLVTHFLSDTGAQQMQANQALADLAVGRSDNLSGVLVSAAKADLAFRLVLEIRNKLMEAYQQIMQMQV